MKKFSQITESYDYDEEKFKPHPAVNKNFWDSKVQPLIDSMLSVSPNLFKPYTIDNLLNLVRSINVDYVNKSRDIINKDPTKFFDMFEMDTDKLDIMHYITDLSDRSSKKSESYILETGEFSINLSELNFTSFDQFEQDLIGTYNKLFMLENCDFEIKILYRNSGLPDEIKLPKYENDGSKIDIIKYLNEDNLSDEDNIISINIYVFNPKYRWGSK